MTAHDVPPDDMAFSGPRDPLDAALRGQSDDPALGAIVHDLRSAYLPRSGRRRSDALAAFAGPVDGVALGTVAAATRAPVPDPAVPFRRRAAVAAAAFIATLTGKVVLGGAVAAATLGGLHATEVVDVPLLPRDPVAEEPHVPVTQRPDAAGPLSVLVGPPPSAPAPSDGSSVGDRPAASRTGTAGVPGAPSEASPTPRPVPGPVPSDERRIRPTAPPATPPADEAPAADPPAPNPPPSTTPAPSAPPPASTTPAQPPSAAPERDGATAERPEAGAPESPPDQQGSPRRP